MNFLGNTVLDGQTCHCTSLYVMYLPAVSLGLMIFTTCKKNTLVSVGAQIVTGRWGIL